MPFSASRVNIKRSPPESPYDWEVRADFEVERNVEKIYVSAEVIHVDFKSDALKELYDT